MSWAYLYTFAQTCAIEFPFYYVFLRRHRSLAESVCAVVALNALTHPLVFFGFMTFKSSLLKDILGAEAFAFGVEAFACWYFLKLRWGRAVAASTLANFASWQLGPMLTYILFFR